MDRDKYDEQFIPETVDEQVEMLLQMRDQHDFRTHPSARLTHDLAVTHQEDKQIMERAWLRLTTQPSVTQTPAYQPATQYERAQHMYPNNDRPQRRPGRQRLMLLIASLVVLLFVGSSLAVFAFLRPYNGQISTTLTPTTNVTPLATQKPTLSPTASPTPVPPVSTNCPATGTARAAIMPPLPAGSHNGVLYVTNMSSGNVDNGGQLIGTLSRYDVASGQKTDLLKITVPATLQNNQTLSYNGAPQALSDMRLSNDRQWIIFKTAVEGKEAVQLVRADGQELQTLYCTTVDKDLWDALSFSPNTKYITFEEVPVSFGTSPQNLMLLELATGKLQVAAQVSQTSAIYEPIKWRDNTSLYANYSRIGVGDTRNRHQVYLLPDVTQNSTPQEISIPTISGASNDTCKDFDFSPDNTQLLVSDCTGDARGLITGPSTIETVPLTGGSPQIVHLSQHGIPYARFLTNTTIWFSVDDTVNTDQNGLWKINTDGSGLAQLTTGRASFEDLAYDPTMHISSDNTMFAVAAGNATISIGSLNGGGANTITSSTQSTSLALVGWITF